MARIRTIKPEFWESETVGVLTFGARLLFIASLNLADDEGLLRWNPSYLQSSVFIYDEVTIEQVQVWMAELETGEFVLPYQAGKTNQKLAWIIHFRNHQVINRPQPSKYPGPSIQNPKFKEAIYERDKHICHLCGEEVIHTDKPFICGSKAPSVDHIKPQSQGGNDYPSNLRTAHISCNKSRKDKPLNDSMNDSMNDSVNDSLTEGKGREGKGKEGNGINPPPKSEGEKFNLPGWVPVQAWADFLEMRKKVKKPMTDRAKVLAVNELDELRKKGNDPTAVLNQSVMNSWQGLFEIKHNVITMPKKRELVL